jgi:hypothetical protein
MAFGHPKTVGVPVRGRNRPMGYWVGFLGVVVFFLEVGLGQGRNRKLQPGLTAPLSYARFQLHVWARLAVLSIAKIANG